MLETLKLGVGDLAQGVGDLVGIVGNPLNTTLNATGIPQRLTGAPLSDNLGGVAREISRMPAPVTDQEKLFTAINSGGVGGLGFSGGARALAAGATRAAKAAGISAATPTVAKHVLTSAASSPVVDTVGGMVGNAAAEYAGQKGAGPWTQLAVGFGAGLAGGGAVAIASSLRQMHAARGAKVAHLSDEELVNGTLDGTLDTVTPDEAAAILKQHGVDPAQFTDPAAAAARVQAARARPNWAGHDRNSIGLAQKVNAGIEAGTIDPSHRITPTDRTVPADSTIIGMPEGNVVGDAGALEGIARTRAGQEHIFELAKNRAANDPVLAEILNSSLTGWNKVKALYERLSSTPETPTERGGLRVNAPEGEDIQGFYSGRTRPPLRDPEDPKSGPVNEPFSATEQTQRDSSPTQADLAAGRVYRDSKTGAWTADPGKGRDRWTARTQTGGSDRAFPTGGDDPAGAPGFWEERSRAQHEEAKAKAQADLEAKWEARKKADEEMRAREKARAEQAKARGEEFTGNPDADAQTRYKGKYSQKPHQAGDFWTMTQEGHVAGEDGSPVAFRNARAAAKWAVDNKLAGDFEIHAYGTNTERVTLRRRPNSTYGERPPTPDGPADPAAGRSTDTSQRAIGGTVETPPPPKEAPKAEASDGPHTVTFEPDFDGKSSSFTYESAAVTGTNNLADNGKFWAQKRSAYDGKTNGLYYLSETGDWLAASEFNRGFEPAKFDSQAAANKAARDAGTREGHVPAEPTAQRPAAAAPKAKPAPASDTLPPTESVVPPKAAPPVEGGAAQGDAPPAAPFDPLPHLDKAVEYINDHNAGPITNKALAKHLGVSEAEAGKVLGMAARGDKARFKLSGGKWNKKKGKQTPQIWRRPVRRKGPIDLVTQIADMGGVADGPSNGAGSGGHDLRNTIGQKFVQGAGPLFRKNGGIDLDTLGEHLHENGWFPGKDRPTVRDVIDLIESAVRRKMYHPDEAAAANEADGQTGAGEWADRVDEFIDSAADDLSTGMTPEDRAEIAASMSEGADVHDAVLTHINRKIQEVAHEGLNEDSGADYLAALLEDEQNGPAAESGVDAAGSSGSEPAARDAGQGATDGAGDNGAGETPTAQEVNPEAGKTNLFGEEIKQKPDPDAPQDGSLGLFAKQEPPANGMTDKQRAELAARQKQSTNTKNDQENIDQQDGGMFDAARDQGDMLGGEPSGDAGYADYKAGKIKWAEMGKEAQDRVNAEANDANFERVKADDPTLTREEYEKRRAAGKAFVKGMFEDGAKAGETPKERTEGQRRYFNDEAAADAFDRALAGDDFPDNKTMADLPQKVRQAWREGYDTRVAREKIDASEARRAVEQETIHDKLDAADQAALAAHYGQPTYNTAAKRSFVNDVVQAVNRGIHTVNAAIRSIVKKAIPAILAASVIFHPGGLKPLEAKTMRHFQTVETTEVRATVPTEAARAMASEARGVYEAVAPVAKAEGKGFLIADKPNGVIHAFDKNGAYLASSDALYGKATGDVLTAESMAKTTEQMTDADRVTPAGTFRGQIADAADYAGGKGMVLTDSKGDPIGGVGVHAIYLGNAAEARPARLASTTAADNKISFGCINTSNEFFLEKVLPNEDQFDGGFVFVMPDDVSKTGEMFKPEQKQTIVDRAVADQDAQAKPVPDMPATLPGSEQQRGRAMSAALRPRGPRPTDDRDPKKKEGSRPAWEAVAKLAVDPEVLRGDMTAMKEAVKDPAAMLKAAASPLGHITSFMFSNDGAGRVLAERFNAPAIHELMDHYTARSGMAGPTRGLHEAIALKQTNEVQAVYDLLEPHMADPAAMQRIRDILALPNGRHNAKPSEFAAAKAIAKQLKDFLEYRKDAGVDIGEVTDGYFPRVISPDLAAAKQEQFTAAATKLYQGIGVKDARGAAEAWFNRLYDTYAGLDGALAHGIEGLSGSDSAKSRKFGKDADVLLKDFYEPDVYQTLANYFSGGAKHAEETRRFGIKGRVGSPERAAWTEAHGIKDERGTKQPITQYDEVMARIRAEMLASGEDPKGAMHTLQNIHRSNLGQLGSHNPRTRHIVANINAYTQLRNLPKVVITSLGELTMGINRGGVKEGLPYIGNSLKQVARIIAKAAPDDAARWAMRYGINAEAATDLLSLRGGQQQAGVATRRMMANYFKAVGIHQWTQGQRIAAATMHRNLLKTFAEDLLLSKSARTRSRAELYLKEYGIQDPKTFAERMLTDGEPTEAEHLADKGFANEYTTAIVRGINQTQLAANRGEIPHYASHPVGSMLFSLQNYSYAFKKNVLDRAWRLGKQGIHNRDPHLLLPAMSLALMIGTTEAIDTYLKPWIYGSNYDFENESPAKHAVRLVDRSGMTAGASPIINAIEGVRYRRGIVESVIGPFFGQIGHDAQAMLNVATSTADTNTAKRNAYASLYDAVIWPGTAALASTRLAAGVARSGTIAAATPSKPSGAKWDPKGHFVDWAAGPEEF